VADKVVVALFGGYGAGKDTAGLVFEKEFGYVPFHFADAVREACHAAVPDVNWWNDDTKDVVHPILKSTPRKWLQVTGMFFRGLMPTIWSRQLELCRDKRVVVLDLRFVTEAQAILDSGGLLVRVVRDGVALEGYELSEVEKLWSKQLWAPTLVNDTDIASYQKEVRRLGHNLKRWAAGEELETWESGDE